MEQDLVTATHNFHKNEQENKISVEGNSVHWEMPSLPFYESGNDDVFTEISHLARCIFPEPSVLIHVAEQYMLLPYLEDGSATSDDVKSDDGEDKRNNLDKHDLFMAFNQSRSEKLEATEESEDFDPQLFIRNQPELSEVVSSYFLEMQPKKPVTLVLDLDGMFLFS
ncbi:unnamed protein product [Microthlaspi erraticum]|uniref:FCP1 homology domain-containing protein n=1 Tax=Microthlaspi erraticum TaxID=1685480 RepID=A0A6D2JM50_9BRAS|nr:unnamed protein product [Microthlaspi erraticum]